LKIPRLLAISSPEATPGPAWRRWCGDLGVAGVDGLQVRKKGAGDRELLELGVEARASATASTTLLINSRFDIAIAAGADGVHLPATGLPIAAVRKACMAVTGRPPLVGRSTHHPDEVRAARDEGADFVLFGPVFETPSKAGVLPARGLGALRQAVASGLPVLALGGIDSVRAGQAVDQGAWGVAAIRWFADPAAVTAELAPLLLRWRES
jgi:thiamine-phosphate pyrophosphorylase